MGQYETFGECLRWVLAEAGMSATEAAQLVGFRSRNSIFRILADTTSCDVDARFLQQLKEAAGKAWPAHRWAALEEALEIKRIGYDQYRSNRAFHGMLYEPAQKQEPLVVISSDADGAEHEELLSELLDRVSARGNTEIVMTGCSSIALSRMLAECCGTAASQGRLTIRHYMDTDDAEVTQQILAILPLVGKPWYNARLVDQGSCPPEMLALYRVRGIYIVHNGDNGERLNYQLLKYEAGKYLCAARETTGSVLLPVLDRWRFHLELLKPIPQMSGDAEAFAEFTQRCGNLEWDCTIASIKPDIHFNCVPTRLLESAIIEGFQQAGLASGPELEALIDQLRAIHDSRFDNMLNKHKPTYLVYSLPAMKQFMQTGVQTDHFFLQRAYTVEERREILRILLNQMQENPYFNVYFLEEDMPSLYNEVTLYEGKGLLMLDAYTGYALHDDHSEALITLPSFVQRFQQYFMNELLTRHVMPRARTICELEQMIAMPMRE